MGAQGLDGQSKAFAWPLLRVAHVGIKHLGRVIKNDLVNGCKIVHFEKIKMYGK